MRRSIIIVGCFILGAFFAVDASGQGPVAHWKLDETGGLVAADSSPSGNVGALSNFVGTPWTPGFVGGALQFSGVEYVDCTLNGGLPAYDASGTPFTITAWLNGPPQDDDRYYSEGSASNNSPLYTLGSGRSSNGTMDRFQLFVRNDAGVDLVNAQSAGAVFDNTWHHVAVVDVGGTVRVYIDGVLDSGNFSYTISGTHTNVNRVSLGAVLRAADCCHYNGFLDDLRVYPYALTQAEVNTVMNGGSLQSLCSGDGGDQVGCTGCPCGNESAQGTIGGCVNSAGAAARLHQLGTFSLSASNLRFEASGVVPQRLCTLVSGSSLAPLNTANPCYGHNSGVQSLALDGLRCVVQGVLRHGLRSSDSSGMVGSTNNGWGAPDTFAQFGAFTAGGTRHFQIVHTENPAAICGTGLNTSQAITVVFAP